MLVDSPPLVPSPAGTLAVLIVDDSPDCADSLAEVLGAYGHNVRTAGTATTAVIAGADMRPDVLVMDIGIPGMDGYRLATRLCDLLGYRPLLVAHTGYGGLEERSRQEGFDHHFQKPVDPARVVTALAAHAGQGHRNLLTT